MDRSKVKNAVKFIVGEKNIRNTLAYKRHLDLKKYFHDKDDKLQVLSNDIDNIYEIENVKGHVFCGYYDISPDNPFNEEELLVGMLNKKAIAGKDSLIVAIANYKTGQIIPLTETKTWCWQMGARLRWSKIKNLIYFNDIENGHYCCRVFDISNKKSIITIPYSLYDISSDEQYGLSVNFSRLQRLRPGYGYSNLHDDTGNENAPDNDGLFYIDIHSGKRELVMSYKKLSELLPQSKGKQCYINHISFCPDGSKAMFFFIWETDKRPGWKATLWVINLQTKECKCLEKDGQVSHYNWKNNNELLITGIMLDTRVGFYRLYDCEKGGYIELDNVFLRQDGHPVFSREFQGFYADTYPDSKSCQLLFKYKNDKYIPLLKVYHDPRMFGEKRCDLHPHYFLNEEVVAIDATFDGNKRKVLVIRMKKNER